ncbi:MAG: DUF1573 domain-containing protein [Reichenbachiella sp.]|uniref:DUF1573 domain-containing protein n=1 Tax=Reichenbachiella sp. TaxID=2184521 RepID=UPI003267D08D
MLQFIKSTLFVFLITFSNTILAQDKGTLEFIISDHDFGDIKEEDGPATYEFEFINAGKAPLVISNVRASCGCTTPAWSKEPVLPGEKGFVKAQYNPRNRPGTFRKSLTITTNGNPAVVQAYIRGKVIPKVKSLEEQMTVQIGKTRFKSRSVNIGRLTTEKMVRIPFAVYNDSPDTLRFKSEYEAPDFIQLSFEPDVLAPKQVGSVVIAYNPDHDDNLGHNSHGIQFYTDEEGADAKKINVIASITEYFPPLSEEEKEKAPKLAITDRLQDIGQMRSGESREAEFILTNTGRSNLNIRKIKSNCGCFVAELNKYDIKPGKSAVLKGTFSSVGRRGNQNKSITVFSNDPVDPVQVVSIKASILSAN